MTNHTMPAQRSGGYDASVFDELAKIEDRHFWFRARNLLIYELVRKLCSGLKPGYLVLEAGCGTGNVLNVLGSACPNGLVVGMERFFDGLPHAKRRYAGPLVQGDARDLPFGKKFELIAMFDVLEHIPEERETLVSLREMLAPGGKLILTVPAHQFLWSHFDEAAHHCRRYSTSQLRQSLEETGFAVDFLSQFMACIFPLVWMVRKLGGLAGKGDPAASKKQAMQEFRVVPGVNGALRVLLSLEARWVAHQRRLPFGTSLVVVARRSD
ncbi:MAG: class I SAM-dependent methyltransferase [Acidobacteria bacterium]|nr:MAG: class I SAM-dependent methyltransferase [Acidobacteriota bacterium]